MESAVLFFLLLAGESFAAGVPAAYHRAYQEGEKIRYETTIERRDSGKLFFTERALTEHTVVKLPQGGFAEEIRWKEASRKQANGETKDLAGGLTALDGRHLHTLSAPGAQMEMPRNVSGELINLFTELNRAYFALQGVAGSRGLSQKGDAIREGKDLFGNWSQGANTGLDCFQRSFEVGKTDAKGNLTLHVKYFAPPKPCAGYQFPFAFFGEPVYQGRPNNYGTINKGPDGRWEAVWGNEEFTMEYEVSKSGRLERASTQNPYHLRRRFGCNEKLEECVQGADGKVDSDFLMERSIRVRRIP